jgi:heme-degrading monooxygenase HmoA
MPPVITEHALLHVDTERSAEFEAAFQQATPLISFMPGFGGLSLQRCLERENTYLLLVRWERLEDHIQGFRGSPEYQQWRALLHHFYDPFPTVEHYATVHEA